MDRVRFYARVDDEIRQGRLWRAKEMLGGALTRCQYDPHLFETYGRVLPRMCDMLEAGRFLFLSGIRLEEYSEPIGLFLGRHARKRPEDLHQALPGYARLSRREDYPPAVARELAALGFPEQIRFTEGGPEPETPPSSSSNHALTVGCMLTVILIAFALLGLARFAELVARGLRTWAGG